MVFTRLGYMLILAIMGIAVVAIAAVLWGGGSGGSDAPAATAPLMAFEDVINYSKFGVIDEIKVHGETLTVRFRADFDTKSRTGSDSRTYTSSLPSGQTIDGALAAAGVQGVKVTKQ